MFEKSCIYEIYKWMGVVGKYTGCFPLPGLYEKREWSKWTKAFINYVIPALNLIFLSLIFAMLCSSYKLNRNEDLTDILLVIVEAWVFGHFIMCVLLNHLSLRRNLVSYLKSHSNVDGLLKCKKQRLKIFIRIFFVSMIVLHAVFIGFFTGGFFIKTLYERYEENPFQTLVDGSRRLLISFILSIAIYTHPQLMYIVFQRILKCSFDELCRKIKKNRKKCFSSEMRVKKLRKYMKLYRDLCSISGQLDDTMSPLMLTIFIGNYMKEIYSFADIISTFSVFSLANAAAIVLGSLPLIFVSDVAYLTKKSHDEILPAIYSTFTSGDEAVNTQLQTFALQSMYFNQSFSASGFVQLDRVFILAMVQSLISQVVVFYKIHKENTNNPKLA